MGQTSSQIVKKTSNVDDEKISDTPIIMKGEGENQTGKAKDKKKKSIFGGSFSSFSTATQSTSVTEEVSLPTLTNSTASCSADENNFRDIDAMISSSTDGSIGSPLSDSSTREAEVIEVASRKSFSLNRGSYSTFFPSALAGKSFISKIPSMSHFRLKDNTIKIKEEKVINTTVEGTIITKRTIILHLVILYLFSIFSSVGLCNNLYPVIDTVPEVHEKVVPLNSGFVIKVKDSHHHKKVFINILYLTPEDIETAAAASAENQQVDVQEDDRVYLLREDTHPDRRQELCPTFDVLVQKKLVELCEREPLTKNEVSEIGMLQ